MPDKQTQNQTATTDTTAPKGLLTDFPTPAKWLFLVVISLLLAGVLEYFRLPAALLLGPMISAIFFATNGARISLPRLPYSAAQSVLGSMIAESLNGQILRRFLDDWLLFLCTVLSIVAVSALIGYIMAKKQVLEGTTAVWGTSAGGASAMVLMAEAHGADARLVAFMQYMRVVSVVTTAALIAGFVFNAGHGSAEPLVLFPPVNWQALALTLLLSAASSYLFMRLKIPAGTMLGPMVIMALLHSAGYIEIELPLWLLAITYTMIGWRIGLAFTRRLLRHAMKAAPKVMLSIVTLISFGGCLAVMLWWLADVDPLTAYLATSPGGLDSVAIIAATTHVDIPFVMTLQTVRFVIILALGPSISRFIASRIGK
ncbi:AbrB family transcriptional regulator [Allorhizobium sp. BGMRC 0089]|uniref:AbrB family transcriptional regulator n=1 Tax=Allorhizobium sonneratiae TaxID=2934936 RepID=UPI00203340FB|nr:AbrB family transcriptional regulator [Allorhizobium sonneratiae]MCM2291986.1 AbrB family transcriptional regulator [Allorhizobium sonneratiae]